MEIIAIKILNAGEEFDEGGVEVTWSDNEYCATFQYELQFGQFFIIDDFGMSEEFCREVLRMAVMRDE